MSNTGNTQQQINYGASANDGLGDPLRTAFIKTDDNFDNIWLAGPVGSNITIVNNTVQANDTNGNLILSPNGTGVIQTNNTLVPRANNTYNLGSANLTYRAGHFGIGGITTTGNINAANIVITNSFDLTGNLTAGNVSVTNDLDIGSDVVIGGNLTVNGTTTAINTTNLDVEDKLVTIAYGAANANLANGAGIRVDGANAQLTYNSNTNNWNFNLSVGVTGLVSVFDPVGAGNSWLISGPSIVAPTGGEWFSDKSTGDEFITSAADGYINIQSLYANSSVASELHLEHGLARLQLFDGVDQEWAFNQDGSLELPGNIVTQVSNLAVSVGSNSWVFGNTGALTAPGAIGTTGNITANYFVGNGSLLTGIATSTYGNANVAAYLPTYSGNIQAGNVFVANTITSTDAYITRGSFSGDPVTGDASLYVGSPSFTVLGTDVMAQFTGNVPNYAQLNLQNYGNSPTSSGDYIITADNGTDSTHFLNLGLTNSTWDGTQPNSLGDRLGPNDGYLYVQDGNMVIGTSNGIIETWKFDQTGNLTIPGSIVGTDTILIDNRASGNTADIQLFSADDIILQARDRTLGSGTEGGDINIYAGDSAEDGDASGGDIQIIAGDGGAANVDFGGAGGFITIRSGQGGSAIGDGVSSAESGGSLTLQAGSAGGNNGNIDRGAAGGDVVITAGLSTGNLSPGGDVQITSGQGGANASAGQIELNVPISDAGPGGTWSFNYTGNLTLPAGGSIIVDGGDGVIGPDGDNMVISWDNEDLILRAVGSDVDVEADRAFNIRVNYDVGATDYLTKWVFGQNNEIVNITGNSAIVTEAGNLNLQGGRNTLSSGNVQITAVDNGVAVNTWTFDNTGVLTLPAGGLISEGPSPSYLGNAVTITPANGGDPNQQLKIYPTAAEGNHLHLTSGNLQVTDVFLGDDSQYIRTTTTGGMIVGTGGGEIFGGYAWSFEENGNLIFPDGSSIGGGAFNGTASSTVSLNAFSPDGNTVSFQAQGNTSSAVISIFSNAGPVTSNWTFTTAPLDPSESFLYVPNGGAISTPDATGGEGGKNIFIQAGASDPVTWNSNPGGELFIKGGYGSFGDGGGGPGGNVYIEGGLSSDSHAGNVYLTTGLNNWVFDYTGNVTIPGNINAVLSSPAPSLNGFNSVNAVNVNVSGNISGNTAGFAIGYRDIPQVSFTGNATIATTDAGKHFYSTQSSNYILTIANNASQGFQVGAAITVVNQGTGTITIAQGSGVTLYLAGNASSGNRSVSTFGMATIMKVATDTWFINGTGVS